MKTFLIRATVILAALTVTVDLSLAGGQDDQSIPPGTKGVPPGLQKKGGLPPGQAKKQARQQAKEAEAKETTPAPVIAKTPAPPTTTPSVPSTPAPEVTKPTTPEPPKTTTTPAVTVKTPDSVKPAAKVSPEILAKRAKLEGYAADLDTLAKQKPEVHDRMVVRLNHYLEVPLATIEAERNANPQTGLGGLLVAHHIARFSKQPPELILADNRAGKSWGEIAGERRVSLADLNERMQDAKESARTAERQTAKR